MSYELGVHNGLLGKITAAQAGVGPLAFMAAASIYPAIYPGIESLSPQSYPALALMPDKNQAKFFTTGDPPAKTSMFRMKVILLVAEGAPGLGLLGDPTQTPPLVGLYDFAAAVQNVIETDQTLGGAVGVQKVICETVDYKYDFYPICVCEITVAVGGQLTTRSN